MSVYGEPIKTSNAVESFHSRMSARLTKKGNFYKFLDGLCSLDQNKSLDFTKSLSGCVSLYRKKDNCFERRDKLIKKHLQLLKDNKISLRDILTQFTKMKKTLIDVNYINEIHTSDSESEDNDDENHFGNENQQFNTLCIICCVRQRHLVFEPCKHFKVCQQCYEQLLQNAKEKRTKTLCPYCRAIITNAFSIYF